VLAGNEREALLRVADRLSLELGYSEGGDIPRADSAWGERAVMAGILNSEDELLVAEIRRGLAKVAAAARGGEELDGADEKSVGAALDGAEMVMQGEIAMGNAGRLPALLPGFVFLVALPVVDQDRALELSKRCGQLVERVF
jgi:hypothetical protein